MDLAVNDRETSKLWALGSSTAAPNVFFCTNPSPNAEWNKLTTAILEKIYMDNDRLWGINSNLAIYQYDELNHNFKKIKDQNVVNYTYLGKGSDYVWALTNNSELYKTKKSDGSNINFTKVNIESKYNDIKANDEKIYGVTTDNNIEELVPTENYKIITNNDKEQTLKIFDTLNKMYQVFITPNGIAELGTWTVHHRVALSSKAKDNFNIAKNIVNKIHTAVHDYGDKNNWDQKNITLFTWST